MKGKRVREEVEWGEVREEGRSGKGKGRGEGDVDEGRGREG